MISTNHHLRINLLSGSLIRSQLGWGGLIRDMVTIITLVDIYNYHNYTVCLPAGGLFVRGLRFCDSRLFFCVFSFFAEFSHGVVATSLFHCQYSTVLNSFCPSTPTYPKQFRTVFTAISSGFFYHCIFRRYHLMRYKISENRSWFENKLNNYWENQSHRI